MVPADQIDPLSLRTPQKLIPSLFVDVHVSCDSEVIQQAGGGLIKASVL